jgi:gas vesicle protein
MKRIFLRIHLEHLRSKTHVEYHETIRRIIEKFNPDTLGIRPQYDVYILLLSDELLVLDIILKSEITSEIHAQDHVRDIIFRGFSDAVKSALNHYDETKRNAAYKIEIVLDHYGNIATLTLDEETAAIEDLIRELKTENNTNLLTTLGLIDWLPELSNANDKFKDLMMMRYEEVSQRPTIRMKEIRTAVNKEFRNMIDQLEALIKVKGIAGYEDFVKEINAVTERYKRILAQEAGNRNKDDE